MKVTFQRLLQWGRGFESTETPTESNVMKCCGCGFNGAVDLNPRKLDRLKYTNSTDTQSFNGAVDLNPRKPGHSPKSPRNVSGLQWGRGFESTETADPVPKAEAVTVCFNGAVDLNPRKQRGCLEVQLIID